MWKKLVTIIIFIFIACAVYFNVFFQEKNENYSRLTNIGQTENAQSVVFSTDIKSDDEIYNILDSILSVYNGNIYCFDVETIDNRNIYTKYILVNNMELFHSLSLKKGISFR